jgi:hypothetical protein
LKSKFFVERARLGVVVLNLEFQPAQADAPAERFNVVKNFAAEALTAMAGLEVEVGDGGQSSAEFDVEAIRENDVAHRLPPMQDEPRLTERAVSEQNPQA